MSMESAIAVRLKLRRQALKRLRFAWCLIGRATWCSAFAQSASPPDLTIIRANSAEVVRDSIASDLVPKPSFEVPPTFVGGTNLLFVTTGWSWLCRGSGDIFSLELKIDGRRCRRFSLPLRFDDSTAQNIPPEQAAKRPEDWRRSYDGVFTAVRLPSSWNGYEFFALLHAENKNEKFGDRLYANSVDRWVTPDKCASGYSGSKKQYDDCWDAYNAFVNLAAFNGSPKSMVSDPLDLGPLLWPSAGYIDGERKVSSGLRHPSGFVLDGYLYIYYIDTSHSTEPGRRGGMSVARMVLPKAGSTELLPTLPWYDGKFSNDNASLPARFSKDRIRDFYDKPGGRAQELWPDSWQSFRFSVAELKGSNAFLGVEEYGTEQSWGVRLRTSVDCVHWSAPVQVPGEQAQNWSSGNMHYPIILDERGNATQSVDSKGFFIVGTGSDGTIHRQHLVIRLSSNR